MWFQLVLLLRDAAIEIFIHCVLHHLLSRGLNKDGIRGLCSVSMVASIPMYGDKESSAVVCSEIFPRVLSATSSEDTRVVKQRKTDSLKIP